MADLEKLSIIIDEIKTYLARLEKLRIKSEKDLDDLKFDAVSMIIFSTMNKTIDLAEEVVKAKNLGMPFKYRDLFEFLEKEKIISKKRKEKLSDLTIMRNNLAHRYERITKIKLVHTVKDMKEVKDFTEDIIKYFRK